VLVALGVLGCLFLAIAFCGAHLLVNRRQAKEAQARSEAQYRQLLESAPDAIVAADTSGTMVYANERAVELFGYSQDELQGKKVDALIPPRFRDVHLGHVSRYARALPGLHEMAKGRELYALHRDGREFPAIIALNKIEGPGGQRVIATIHDVTELRQMQAAMAQTTQQLQVSNKNLESFSYSIAHDLRAPLRVLNGFSQILLAEFGDKLDEQARNCADRINSASEHMGSILNGMLALSQVTSSKLVLEDLDMSLLASEVNELLSDEHVDREVEVRIEPGMRARGDRSLIMIVLQNLLANAWKFTSKTSKAQIEMGTHRIDGRTEFYVRDNGAGFDMARSTKLFDAFQRLHSGNEFPGTGIGLATVSRVIEKHGGQIRAEAAVALGATFYFSLGEKPLWEELPASSPRRSGSSAPLMQSASAEP
jgi:PAS domain S-box-containing protein